MQQITIIGIYDQPPVFSDEAEQIMADADYFAGGKRHHELVAPYLPSSHDWSNIVVPLDDFFTRIRRKSGKWVVFASGDPLFFGIGNTLQVQFPDAVIKQFPAFNALQLLGHRLSLNYGQYPVISLTGRPWQAFDESLIRGIPRMGILTDRKKTPAVVAKRMLQYGYGTYRMHIGERMGGPRERVSSVTLQEAGRHDFEAPNCLFLEATEQLHLPPKGIPDTELEHLPGRPRMMTKMPVRQTTLSLMELHHKRIFWDIGACTGSISVEARLAYPHLQVTAFEKRNQSESLIRWNAEKHGAPGINLLMGDYLEVDKRSLQQPDAVFLGGYGGAMEKVLNDLNHHLVEDGVVAFNAVSEVSRQRFQDWCSRHGYHVREPVKLRVDDHNPIEIVIAVKGLNG